MGASNEMEPGDLPEERADAPGKIPGTALDVCDRDYAGEWKGYVFPSAVNIKDFLKIIC